MRRATLALAALLASCATSTASRDALNDALAEYTHGMRWSKQDFLRRYLPKTGRLGFEPTAPGGVQMITCEVESVNVDADARSAVVGIRVEWMKSNEVQVRSTLLMQTWRSHDDRWEIVEQRTSDGPAFPPPRPRARRG